MSRRTVVALALVAVFVVLATGWVAGAAFARTEAPAAGTSVPAAEGYGLIALRNTYDPGERATMHAHARPRLVVVLSGGTFEVTGADGQTRSVDLAAGQVMLRGPESHALKNVGATTIETIEMEFPECAGQGQQP